MFRLVSRAFCDTPFVFMYVDVSRRFGTGSLFENRTDTHGKQRAYISLYNMFNV